MKTVFRIFVIGLWAVLATVARAQATDEVVLIADHVYLSGTSRLTAEGNVEALRGDIRIQARKIVYDSVANRVTVTGPIRLTQGDSITILASAAELDTDFRNGLIRSARIVMDNRVQLMTRQMKRVDGRFNVMGKTSVTSCKVCDNGQPPLWQIRAKRIVHDEDEQQIYFDNAQFRVLDVPVMVLPKLRLPDPTLDRATGFLIPTIRNNSNIGTGFKLPYFIRLGDHKDLTLTPYPATNAMTLEGRYRQAFRNGRITFNGAVSTDNFGPQEYRGYLFGQGRFELRDDYRLTFNLKTTSDDSYLLDYDYSTLDRLDSDVTLRRSRRDENTRFALLHYESLRAQENNGTLPTLVAVAQSERRYFPQAIGGELRLRYDVQGHYRTSSLGIDSADDDTIVDGRDVAGASASAQWRRIWTVLGGARLGVTGELAADLFHTTDDDALEGTEAGVTPLVAADLRYPMTKVGADGRTYVLEPVAQIAWSGGSDLDIANEESTRIEFDEGNLLSLSRFPAEDRRERGLRAAYGLNWARYAPDGALARLSIAQVFRQDADADFTRSSGLMDQASDFLLAGQWKTTNGFELTARGLFDGSQGINKAAARASWKNQKLRLSTSYIWLGPDLAEDRDTALSEWAVDSKYRMSRHWSGLADWRYDVASGKLAEAGVGLEYRNECVKLDFSVSRRFTSSSTVQPSTSIGFTVALLGFSVRTADKSYDRTCRGNAG
ncbi:LPS-assembly protein LptD [Shimia biformata]|uniref:LPS-assembly protein LptD n=1 Tax=Shimia biformata TaxID=1294299 RepID=UPI0019523D2E|nr:LPS assembly protein LptD [Shimia biformata]